MALLPAWIIGSVLVIAIVDWMRTPKGARHDQSTPSAAAYRPSAA